ncbi:MAG: sporulation transcriptional regulator SpoIIID [Clostridia bacterium]|nr:sporulation transcriptional regulator SpoIIID [Clostridia bacterium]
MKDYIEERTIEVANYIIENKCTVRAAAKHFNISKSTVHKDVAERLWEINQPLAKAVHVVLSENKADRHIRGGQATKRKYETKKEENKKM